MQNSNNKWGPRNFVNAFLHEFYTWDRKAEILSFTTLWIKINYFYVREIQQKIVNKIFSAKFHVFNFWCEITHEIMQFTNNFVSFRVISYKQWRGVAILKYSRIDIDDAKSPSWNVKKSLIDIFQFSYAIFSLYRLVFGINYNQFNINQD